jgi:hypothetical protein
MTFDPVKLGIKNATFWEERNSKLKAVEEAIVVPEVSTVPEAAETDENSK